MRRFSFVRSIFQWLRWLLSKLSTKYLFLAAAIIALAGVTFSVLIAALSDALLFDGFAANGAFQLMNPLRRLAAGQIIGNDFNFFHGIGVPLIHLPFYYLFGQGLSGSEFARWFVSPAIFLASAFVFFYVFRRKFVFALCMAVGVTTIAMHIMPFLVLPLTSLLGVRSVIPVFLLAVVLKQDNFKRPLSNRYRWLQLVSWYELIVGFMLALGFICGTEFGIAAILGFTITNVLYSSDGIATWRQRFFSTGRILAIMAGSAIALFTLITRGTPLQPIRFALEEIPMDQFWYFGVPPNDFLYKGNLVSEFMHDPRLLVMLGIAAIAAGVVYALHRLRVYRVQCQTFIYALLAGGFAMVSMLGYYHNSEASALARMSLIVIAAGSVLLLSHWKKPLRLKLEVGKKRFKLRISPAHALKTLGLLCIALAVLSTFILLRETKKEYDIVGALNKAKNYALGRDTSLLGGTWHAVDDAVMPVIQADNNMPIADVNEKGYSHGISLTSPEVILEPGEFASFVRPGQIVYFSKSGRQIIKTVQKRAQGQYLVRLESTAPTLDPDYDGAPNKLIFAEDFHHDNGKVWMLYSGLLNEEMGTFNPTDQGYDYIIHALGPERRAEYVNDFKATKPEYVLTLTKPYFRYEEWVQNAHWDFYSLLDENYEVVKESSIYAVWKRRDEPWSNTHRGTEWKKLTVDQKDQEIKLPNISFDGVPNMEEYMQESEHADYEQQLALGKKVQEHTWMDKDAYDKYLVAVNRAQRDHETWRRENSGKETNANENAAWLNAVKNGGNDFDAGPPPPGELHIDRPRRQVVLVKLHYQASHPLSFLPLVGKTTRYFAEGNNVYSTTPVSLRPYANEIVFPIVISELNKDPYLRLKTYSMLPGNGDLKVTSAEWTLLDTSIANEKILTD